MLPLDDRQRALLRDILLQEWDPLGVYGATEDPRDVEDEYDDYIEPIAAILCNTEDDKINRIAAYLEDVQRHRMVMVSGQNPRVIPVAALLVETFSGRDGCGTPE
jgi:hypothetical protein